MVYIIIGTIAILISFIASIIQYKKAEPLWLRLFPWYLGFTMTIQLGGYLYSHFLHKSNYFIFNIQQIADFVFWVYIFLKVYKTKSIKVVFSALTAFAIIFAVYDITLGEGFYNFNSKTITIISIVLIIFSLLYFAELFMNNNRINYFTIPTFWICTGLFFYNLGSIIYLGLFNYITSHKLDEDGKIYGVIMVTLNILMYALFTIGFFCRTIWKKMSY